MELQNAFLGESRAQPFEYPSFLSVAECAGPAERLVVKVSSQGGMRMRALMVSASSVMGGRFGAAQGPPHLFSFAVKDTLNG